MAEPEVLILDELSLGLSPLLALTLFESLVRLKKTGLTMLLVEQNVTMALGGERLRLCPGRRHGSPGRGFPPAPEKRRDSPHLPGVVTAEQ